MKFALQSYSPRSKPLQYDSLLQAIGCQNAEFEEGIYSLSPIETVCVFEHSVTSSVFNQSDQLSYCAGPLALGGALPWASRWASWVSQSGVRYGQFASILLPANALGSVSPLYPSSKPQKLTFGFTSLGYIATAIQLTATSIELKYYSDAGVTITTQSWTGYAPLLFNDGLLHITDKPNDIDLVCFYLKPASPTSLFARFERDGFATEFVINDLLQVRLSNLIQAEAINGKLVIYGRDIFNRDVTITTRTFPIIITPDKSSLEPSIVRGAYLATAIRATVTGDKSAFSQAIIKGTYGDVVIRPATALTDASTLDIGITSGEYS